jgi:hypothetical protein
MKTTFYISSLLLIAIIGSACASAATGTSVPVATASSAGLGLEPAPWQDGTTVNYQWLDDASGAQIGTSEFSFFRTDGEWTVTEVDTIGDLDQTIEMRANADTLEPLGEKKTITTSSTNAEITTTYEDGTLSITAVVNGKTTSASIDVPSNAIDNDQFLMTLRALPFAEGYGTSYVVIVAQNALKVNTSITVLSKESVEVPAGSFETWHVAIQAAQSTQNAWYQVDAPYGLIQYDNGTNRMVLSE